MAGTRGKLTIDRFLVSLEAEEILSGAGSASGSGALRGFPRERLADGASSQSSTAELRRLVVFVEAAAGFTMECTSPSESSMVSSRELLLGGWGLGNFADDEDFPFSLCPTHVRIHSSRLYSILTRRRTHGKETFTFLEELYLIVVAFVLDTRPKRVNEVLGAFEAFRRFPSAR